MKKVSRTSKKGFTLVELLVVIGIIGLLAAIILPKFTGYTDKATQKNAVADARNITTKLAAYYAEHGVYPDNTTSTQIVDGAAADADFWGTELGLAGTVSNYSNTDGSFTYVLVKGKTFTVTVNAKGVISDAAIS